MKSIAALGIITFAGAAGARHLVGHSSSTARPAIPTIVSMSVCGAIGDAQGSCPAGALDTHKIAIGQGTGGMPINELAGATSDEHSSVFPPGALNGNTDYVFFVSSGVTGVNPDVGLVALSSAGPDGTGQWTMNFANNDGYDFYPKAGNNGALFLAPSVQGKCPLVADGLPQHQDPTFDLGYASPGSIVTDPSRPPGGLVMVYEGANACVGSAGGDRAHTGAYESTAIATSTDFGHTWPTYRGHAAFDFDSLPFANKTQGPFEPLGALGPLTCVGNNCGVIPPWQYGRYQAITPPVSLAFAMAIGQPLPGSMGNSEPSAFVDDAHGDARFLYSVTSYLPGGLSPNVFQIPGRSSDLTVARAAFTRGVLPFAFLKWSGNGFGSLGIGGVETTILPNGDFRNCADVSQGRSQGSISFVDETRQYLLLFVCSSEGNPGGLDDPTQADPRHGSAWFFATTSDLSTQQWSAPVEVRGSWAAWDTGDPPGSFGCPSYKGWYPSVMSLAQPPGHLSTQGYVFYMWGCLGGSNASPPPRQYSSRAFTIQTSP